MLNVYTRDDVDGLKYIKYVDEYFNEHWQAVIKIDRAKEIMKKIDRVSKFTADTMTTPFGTTVYTNLSSGCKALLLANYSKKLLIDIRCAGNNVRRMAETLCDEYEDLEMNFYTGPYYEMQTEGTICYDGKIVNHHEAMEIYFDTMEDLYK